MTGTPARTSPCAAGADQKAWVPARPPAGAGSANGRLSRNRPVALARGGLPQVGTILAVTARPGAESAGLGGLLSAFHRAGARVALLCLTRGEASPFNSTCGRLEAIRPRELQVAAGLLGVSSVAVADYPDGGLRYCRMSELTDRVRRSIAEYAPDLLLVLDPARGDYDDAEAAEAACLAAGPASLPVIARTTPGTRASWPAELEPEANSARADQRSAARAHASQSEALPGVLSSLDGLGGREHLRWLLPPAIRVTRVSEIAWHLVQRTDEPCLT